MGEMDDIAPITPSPLEITLGGKDKSTENKVVVRMQIGWTWDEMRWKKYDPEQWFLCLSISEFGFWGFQKLWLCFWEGSPALYNVSKNQSISVLQNCFQFFHHESQSLWQCKIYHSDVEVRMVILQLEFEQIQSILSHKGIFTSRIQKEGKDC